MAYLPEELVIEIMSWLPPESLLKSKCVNKYWYALITSLINDPSFVTKHLLNLNDNNNNDDNTSPHSSIALTCLRVAPNPVHRHGELFSLLSLSNAANDRAITSATEFLDLPTIPEENDMSCVTASHCNGVICLADYYHTIVLSNPSLNKSRTVPEPGLVDRFVLQGVGFGYDSERDDYKVVRFGRDMSFYTTRAEVYSLRADSWKEIGIESGEDCFPALNVELYFKGHFYWLMSGHNGNYAVRCFDMCDEVFRTVALPDGVRVASADWTSLGVWKERVALFLSGGNEGGGEVGPACSGTRTVEVWALNDEGSCLWDRVLTLGPLEGIDCPLAFWKRDELLMRGSNCKEVVSCNVRTNEVRSVDVDGLDGIGSRAFSYVKSLVSV